MAYRTILVNIDIDGPIAPVVNTATGFARAHDAKLIGLCAADAPMPTGGPDAAGLMVDAWMQMRDFIEERLKEVRAEFERLAAGSGEIEWRQALAGPTRAMVEAARSADVLVMAAAEGAATGNAYRVADPAGVVLRAGRPLLVVAGNAGYRQARKIVVAWKDAREARRAVADAVPLLAAAEEVIVVTVASEIGEGVRAGVNDAVSFLAGHGIAARPELIERGDESAALFEFIGRSGAELVVSGAYGHSRLREWAFGGVTRSLLDETGLNRFMSS